MLSSGPKSYYDEYVRKKESDRAFAKPPALLTDRNAYINFLEVQLERVSAACFAVQSYENRFNDMQGLIVALDERCNNTTRLISLAQQGTEEVRSEAYQRADFEAQNARTFRLDTKKTMDAMSSKVAVLERSLSSFPHIEGKLNAIDKRINEMEASQVNALLDNRVANQALDERINKLDAVKDELIALVESTRAGLSRVTFDVEDNNTRVNNYMSNIESRVNATMQASKEDILRELSSLQAKSTNQIDEVKKSIELRDLEILNVTKKQYTALGEELDASRRKWSQELDGLGVHLKEDADRRVQKAQHSLHQTIQQLHSAQTEQAGFMCDIEQTFLGQLEGVHTSMRDIAQHQQAVEEKVATAQSTQKDLESRMQELQTSISMSSPIRHSVGNWAGGHSGTPPRSFVAHNYDISNPTGNVSAQAGPDARMFPHTSDLPPSFPMSPVPHGGDTSFAFAPDMRNISGMTGAPSVPGVPCIPAGSYPPAYGYPQSTFAQHSSNDREFQQAAAPLNTDSRASQEPRRSTRTKSPSATSVNRREGINVRMPLRSTSPNLAACSSLRRSTGSVPRQSLSQSRSQSQGRGGAGPIRSASLSPGRTVRRQQQQQPSVDGAEVIQRFMEMFQADKQEIAQRLDALGALSADTVGGKPSRRKASLRKKGKQQSIREENPADQLGNFLLNYRKERADIMSRLSRLRTSEAAAMEEVADEPDEEDRSQSAPSAEEKKFAPDEESSSVVEGKPVPAETNTSLSRSMDEFVRTFRNRGNEKTSRPATNSSRSLSPTQGGSAESVSSDGSSTSHHGRNTSPQRLSRSSTTSWLSGVREGQPPQKRYMQMTESHSIARSLSPQATAAVDRSAVVWEYDNVALKPLWKKPNTYQSPCRAAQSSCSSSRANSTSPGARTAAALIDRLAKQDRSASGVTTAGGNADAPAAVSSSVDSGALRTSSQTQRSQVSLAANAAESSDAASVVSTSTTTSTSSSRKH